jgi:hypothetical protein
MNLFAPAFIFPCNDRWDPRLGHLQPQTAARSRGCRFAMAAAHWADAARPLWVELDRARQRRHPSPLPPAPSAPMVVTSQTLAPCFATGPAQIDRRRRSLRRAGQSSSWPRGGGASRRVCSRGEEARGHGSWRRGWKGDEVGDLRPRVCELLRREPDGGFQD